MYVCIVEVIAVFLGRAVVLAEDLFEDVDPETAGLVTTVVADTPVTIGVLVVVIMLVLVVGVVMRVPGSISVVVEASHGSISVRLSERYRVSRLIFSAN